LNQAVNANFTIDFLPDEAGGCFGSKLMNIFAREGRRAFCLSRSFAGGCGRRMPATPEYFSG
jgi:hypothetical protein